MRYEKFDRTFRDSEGNIAIAQMPKLPLLVGLVATILPLLLPSGKIRVSSVRSFVYLGLAGTV